jgi:GNAT superfamily N-acetyltransferase
MSVERNPPDIQGPYLAGLNVCFREWGGSEMLHWSFQRAFDGRLPDVLVLREEGRILAGSALNYRSLSQARRAPLRVAILGGAWTLPEARKHGAFTRLIQESRTLAADRGAALLLAFVTSINPSYRRLAAAGAAQWDTHYLASTPDTPVVNSTATVQPVSDVIGGVMKILEGISACQTGCAQFLYDLDDWTTQFLKRPTEIEFLAINDDMLAVVERHGDADRVLYVSCADDSRFSLALNALFARASGCGRALMLFTTSRAWSKVSSAAGFSHLPGYLMALPANEAVLRESAFDRRWQDIEWCLQSGDRM